MTILYFGSYKASYPRNKVIIDGLRQNGVRVIECNEYSSSRPKYIRLALKFFRIKEQYDFMLVGFPGQEVMFLARLLTRKPIIFDVFTSHYMGYILDRKYFSEKSWRAKYYRWIDRWSCKLADLVLLDTDAHISYFVNEFNLPRHKFLRIFLGANAELHHPAPSHPVQEKFSVLFWGSFIPLQGVEYIIAAAKLLQDQNISFTLVGSGQLLEQCRKLAGGLQNVEFTGRLSDEELIKCIAYADVCLGAFGGGVKTDITIQNKIYETLASQKPLITARTTAIQELLIDNLHCLLCEKANPQDLADKIIQLKNDESLRMSIAQEGYTLFVEKLSAQSIGAELKRVIQTSYGTVQ